MYHLISIGQQMNPTLRYEKHTHPHWEITYYIGGEGINVTDGETYPFSPGTIICQPPFLEHQDISKAGYTNIFFCVEDLSFPFTRPVLLHDTESRDFLTILRQMYSAYFQPGHQKITDALLNVLYEYLVRFIHIERSNHYVRMLERDIIDSLSNSSYSITEAMKKSPLAVDHFRRTFQREVGISPHRYLCQLRIAGAKQLLRTSSLPVKDIAVMCGFDDPYYFSRLFKKYVGQSPAIWRNGDDWTHSDFFPQGKAKK